MDLFLYAGHSVTGRFVGVSMYYSPRGNSHQLYIASQLSYGNVQCACALLNVRTRSTVCTRVRNEY
jgi:hypothetical protein